MKKLALIAALALPLLAQAGPPAGAGAGAPDEAAHRQKWEKRMRMARTLGLAEALDLQEAEALRMRDVMAGFDARSAPLRTQMREAMEVVRRAARGDGAAQKGLDEALKKLSDGGTQLRAIHQEMFQAISKDLSPERKARAALFLHRFHQRMQAMGKELRHRFDGRGGDQGMGPGMRPGMGPGGGGGGRPQRFGMLAPGDGPDVEILPDDDSP